MSHADLSTSNSLADLATRIRAEHEASALAMKRGLEHAINAGRLLIEAKKQLAHGQWLPWLHDHCQVPERTCQAYMRVARSFDAMGDDAKAQRVADLSFRDALHSLAVTGDMIVNKLPPGSYERALQGIESHDHAETWRQAIRRVRMEDARARFTLETPPALLPSPHKRKMRIARNPKERQWMLAVGPDISRAALKEKQQAAYETPVVRELQLQKSELLDRAAALEAEAKALRKEGDTLGEEINAEVRKVIGPVEPFTVTYDFQAGEETDAELAALPQDEIADVLVLSIGVVSEELEEINRGYWGDMNLMSSQQIAPTPQGPQSRGWTRMGSPEWLGDLFPGWNQSEDDCGDTEPPTREAEAT